MVTKFSSILPGLPTGGPRGAALTLGVVSPGLKALARPNVFFLFYFFYYFRRMLKKNTPSRKRSPRVSKLNFDGEEVVDGS